MSVLDIDAEIGDRLGVELVGNSAGLRRPQFRLATLFLLTTLIAIIVGIVAIRRETDPRRRIEYWEDRLVGQSWATVVDRLGPPEAGWDGHYGLPDIHFVKRHPIAKTLIFPQPGGKLYVCFERKGPTWVTITCSYNPDGWVMD